MIDKSMILLKMRCTLPHHSSSSKETGCCWTTRSGASLRNFVISSIFINAPATALRERLVGRKLAGGVSLADAEAFYDRTDGPNVRRVLKSLPANLTLMMTATGEYRLVD